MRNIFLEKAYTKSGETIPRPFSKKLKISGSIVYSLTQLVFVVCQVGGYRNILKLRCITRAFTSNKDLKTKRRSGTSLPVSFSA